MGGACVLSSDVAMSASEPMEHPPPPPGHVRQLVSPTSLMQTKSSENSSRELGGSAGMAGQGPETCTMVWPAHIVVGTALWRCAHYWQRGACGIDPPRRWDVELHLLVR